MLSSYFHHCLLLTQDFYEKECWKHHPLPYSDFVEFKKEECKAQDKARQFVIRD